MLTPEGCFPVTTMNFAAALTQNDRAQRRRVLAAVRQIKIIWANLNYSGTFKLCRMTEFRIWEVQPVD